MYKEVKIQVLNRSLPESGLYSRYSQIKKEQ